jgi:hypothetical protein
VKYQILSVTLAKGNPVYLTEPFEMGADNITQLGAKVSDLLFGFGLEVTGVNAVFRGDIEQAWEREPEKPNLFNGNGEDPDALPKKRGPKKKKPLLIEDASGTKMLG